VKGWYEARGFESQILRRRLEILYKTSPDGRVTRRPRRVELPKPRQTQQPPGQGQRRKSGNERCRPCAFDDAALRQGVREASKSVGRPVRGTVRGVSPPRKQQPGDAGYLNRVRAGPDRRRSLTGSLDDHSYDPYPRFRS